MKYYKLHVLGFTSAGNGMYDNLIGTVVGKDGKPLYTHDEDSIKTQEYIMQSNPLTLAADGASVVTHKNMLVENFTNGDTLVKDYDFSFTLGDEEVSTVVTVRLNEKAAQKFYEEFGQKLKATKADR